MFVRYELYSHDKWHSSFFTLTTISLSKSWEKIFIRDCELWPLWHVRMDYDMRHVHPSLEWRFVREGYTCSTSWSRSDHKTVHTYIRNVLLRNIQPSPAHTRNASLRSLRLVETQLIITQLRRTPSLLLSYSSIESAHQIWLRFSIRHPVLLSKADSPSPIPHHWLRTSEHHFRLFLTNPLWISDSKIQVRSRETLNNFAKAKY